MMQSNLCYALAHKRLKGLCKLLQNLYFHSKLLYCPLFIRLPKYNMMLQLSFQNPFVAAIGQECKPDCEREIKGAHSLSVSLMLQFVCTVRHGGNACCKICIHRLAENTTTPSCHILNKHDCFLPISRMPGSRSLRDSIAGEDPATQAPLE